MFVCGCACLLTLQCSCTHCLIGAPARVAQVWQFPRLTWLLTLLTLKTCHVHYQSHFWNIRSTAHLFVLAVTLQLDDAVR